MAEDIVSVIALVKQYSGTSVVIKCVSNIKQGCFIIFWVLFIFEMPFKQTYYINILSKLNIHLITLLIYIYHVCNPPYISDNFEDDSCAIIICVTTAAFNFKNSCNVIHS